MKRRNYISGIIILSSILLVSCSTESAAEEVLDGEFLTFKTATKHNSTVLYSKWIASQFPNSSLNSSEFFNLPLIKNSLFNPQKDVIMVYGRRNTIFTLPVTMPQDAESYMVEVVAGVNGTTTRLRVTSLDLSALQDIFFRPSANAEFRVVIIPGEKLLGLKSSVFKNFEKMTYEQFTDHFELTE